jgi:biopolymer transport protein ExbB
MRSYGYSKLRIALFVALIGAILLLVSTTLGQGAAAAGAGTGAGAGGEVEKSQPGIFSTLVGLVLDHLDVVFFTIMFCSVIAVTLIIKGFMQVRPSVMIPESSTQTMREMIANKQFKELLEFTEKDDTFVSRALNPALKRAPSFQAMKEALETAIGEETAEQFRKIEYLNIIGNLGPLLGLLGTVMGMIQAFAALKAAGGNANPSELAGGISAALTHTFLGLALAIPCLAAFGVLRTMVDRLTIRGSLIAEEMLLAIRPQEAKTAKKPTGETAAAEV